MKENPFRFGQIVGGDFFTNRQKEIDAIKTDLLSGQNIILTSPRRYGKSSLILKILSEIDKKVTLCIYVDLFGLSSKKRFAEVYSAAIARGTSRRLEEFSRTIRGLIPSLTPKIVLKEEGLPTFEVEFGDRGVDIDRLLETLYDAPQLIAEKRKRPVIVVFDEFQEISVINGDGIQHRLRAKIQHHRDVAYCFLGSKRHLIDELFLRQKSPFFRSGKLIYLGKIPKDEISEFVKRNFHRSGINVSPGLVERILQITGNHPYFVQMFGYELWNIGIFKECLEEPDLETALNRILAVQNYAYTNIWDSLAPKQRNLTLAMAYENTSNLQAQEKIQRYELGSPSTVAKNLKTLETKEILERTDGEYIFADPFFREWIRRL